MGYYSSYIINLKQYEDKLFKQPEPVNSKIYIPKETMTKNNQSKTVKKLEEGVPIAKDYLEKEDLSEKKSIVEPQKGDEIDSGKSNLDSSKKAVKKNIESDDSLENYNTKEEQSVFKVSTVKIQENLSNSDKLKLLYISLKLGKENYKKMEGYLYAKDTEKGVLKALKLLKDDLSIKEYEKVRKIAGKFIDMDAVESLY